MKVSEHFYSIQAEGATIGVPAVFIRLQGCNLNCTWCDTREIWHSGNEVSNEEILEIEERWERVRQFAPARHAVAPFERLIWRHSPAIIGELSRIRKRRQGRPEFIQNEMKEG